MAGSGGTHLTGLTERPHTRGGCTSTATRKIHHGGTQRHPNADGKRTLHRAAGMPPCPHAYFLACAALLLRRPPLRTTGTGGQAPQTNAALLSCQGPSTPPQLSHPSSSRRHFRRNHELCGPCSWMLRGFAALKGCIVRSLNHDHRRCCAKRRCLWLHSASLSRSVVMETVLPERQRCAPPQGLVCRGCPPPCVM